MTAVTDIARSTSAGRCRPASRCSRRAPAPARRSPSPPSPRATSPRARRSTSCCWSRSRAWRPASCASASASGWSSAEQALDRALAGEPPTATTVVELLADGHARARSRSGATGSPARSPTSTPRRSPPPTASARRCSAGSASPATSSPTPTFVEDLERPARRGRRRPLRAPLRTGRDTPAVRPRARRWRIARIAVDNPAAPIEPARRADGHVAAMRRRARARRARRARRAASAASAVMTYDDLLTRLDDDARRARAAGRRRAAARALPRRARRRVPGHRPLQWEIMRRAFGDGGVDARPDRRPEAGDLRLPRRRRLRLPRGRAATAGTQATLDVNWRSDQGLIDAYDALFGGAKLGHEGIVYRRVRAADADRTPRLTGAPSTAPLRIRVVDRARAVGRRATGLRDATAAARARRRATSPPTSCAARLERRDRDRARTATPARARPPGHVAVLVRTNRNAALSATRWTRPASPP